MKPKRIKITYLGGFHNSESITLSVRLFYSFGYPFAQLSRHQERKLDKHFCGIKGCTCGGASRAEVLFPSWYTKFHMDVI